MHEKYDSILSVETVFLSSKRVVEALIGQYKNNKSIGELADDVEIMLQPRWRNVVNLSEFFGREKTLGFISDNLDSFKEALNTGAFRFQDHRKKETIVITMADLSPKIEERFPGGDIKNVLNLENPPEGDYYLQGGLGFNLSMGGDLVCAPNELVLVRVEIASTSNGLIGLVDGYDHGTFSEGDTVLSLGEFSARLSLASIRYILNA